jgi:hypothetical protein
MSDYFFYDLNKKMADLADKQQLREHAVPATQPKSKLTEAATDYSAKKAAAGKDIGKPGKNFSKIAAGAAKRYGSAEAGKRVAGAVLNKLRHPSEGLAEGRNEVAKGTPDAIKLQIKKLGLGPYRRESTGSGGEAIFVFKNPNYYIYQGQDGNWVLVQTNTESDQQGVAEAGKKYDHRDPEHHELDAPRPLIYGLKINGKIWKKDGNVVTFFTKERALSAKKSMLNKKPELEITLIQRPKD